MRPLPVSRTLLLLALASIASPAGAAWSPITVAQSPTFEYAPVATTDASTGAIVAWFDHDLQAGTGAIYVHHVLVSDALDPGWPAGGLLVGAADLGGAIVSDGAGGAIVAWSRGAGSEIYAHHVLANGTLDPAWPAAGVLVATTPNFDVRAVSDAAGGVILVWTDSRDAGTQGQDVYAHRVLSTGVVDPSWAVNGVGVCTEVEDQEGQVAVSDGSGGVIIAWEDYRNGTDNNVFVQRLLSTGAVATGWTAGGVQLCSAAEDQYGSRICSDEAGGAIVSWSDYRSGINYDIYAMRIRPTGALGQGWQHDGEVVCDAAGFQEPFAMVADGSGGAVISWSDFRAGDGYSDIYVQKMTASGSDAWAADGVALCTAPDYQVSPSLGSDGAGGAYVAWQDRRHETANIETDLYAHHVSSTGSPDPTWPTNGGRLTFDGWVRFGSNYEQPLLATGSGSAFVFWAGEVYSGHEDVYATGINATWTPRYTMSLAVSPSSAGSVAKSPDQSSYAANANVTLTATPATGYAFANWSGDAGGTINPIVVTMTSDKNVTSNFIGYAVNVEASPAGSGTVTRNPDQATYAPGSQVTLTAASSFPFLGWSEDASGTTNPLTITVDAAKNVTANFQAYTMTTAIAPAGLGTVSVSPIQSFYALGADVSLTAMPVEDASFSSWSGDASGSDNPLSIVMDGNKNVTATFAVTPPTCGGWSLIPSSPAPSPRQLSSAIWDPVRHRMIVFAGGQSDPTTYLNDVWAFTIGGSWTQITTTGGPPEPRIGAWACYDPVRDRLLVYGGTSKEYPGILEDLWALTLSGTPTWSQITPSGTPRPGPRYSPTTMIYDPVRDRLLFFGGVIRCGMICQIPQDDTWELSLDGTPTWTQLSPSGPLPPASGYNGAVYDPVRDRMLVFGSVGTWALTLSGTPTWSDLNPIGAHGTSYVLGAAYDPARDQVLFVGQGRVSVLDFKYQPMWATVIPIGTMARNAQTYPTSYNADLGAVMIFGGISPQGFKDTWMRLDLTGGNTLVAGAVNGSVLVDHDRWCFGSGETASLLAAPANGYQFSQWLGDASGSDNPLLVAMSASKVIRAEFVLRTTGVEEPPLAFALGAIHPNPSAGRVSVEYSLARDAHVHLGVYDLAGRKLASLVDGMTTSGRRTAEWDGRSGRAQAPSGIYFVRLVTPAGVWVKRLSLMR